MKRVITGIALTLATGAANAACIAALCINPGGQVQIGPKLHGNWSPYNGASVIQYVEVPVPGPTVTVEVPGPTVVKEVPGPTQTVTVEKEKIVKEQQQVERQANKGDPYGPAFAILTATAFYMAACQKEQDRAERDAYIAKLVENGTKVQLPDGRVVTATQALADEVFTVRDDAGNFLFVDRSTALGRAVCISEGITVDPFEQYAQ
jgi:hypothetical protein